MKAKDSASSSGEIAVFQAYVDLINSERETNWARHNALLVANSLIIGALAISPAALWENKWAALGMIGAGLLAADHGAGMVGDAPAPRHCRRIRVVQFQTPGQSVGRDLLQPGADAGLLPHPVGDRSLCALMYLGLGYVRLALV